MNNHIGDANKMVAAAAVYEVSYVSPMNFGGFCAQIITPTKIEPGTKLYPAPRVAAANNDPSDPWRGLYAPELMPQLDGADDYHAAHPDLPDWLDEEERSIAPLIFAQGFTFHVICDEYPDEGDAPGEEFDTCAWLANWKPEPPEGEHWRLAMIHDTEDGPAAVFVRPLAMIMEALTATATAELKKPAPAAPGIDLATAIRNCCEAERADPDHPDTIWINVNDLTAIMQQCVIDASTAQAAPGIDLAPRPMATAPRDGTMLRLLVQFDDHATDDTKEPAWTIGHCSKPHPDDDDNWQFAGWCWDHDHFTEGKGTPVGWLPLIDASPKGGSTRFFSADPAIAEFSTHDTLQAAIDGATSMLSDAADEAHEGGWSDEPPQICYGVVLGACIEIEGSRKPAPEGSDFTEHVEFKLEATSLEVGA